MLSIATPVKIHPQTTMHSQPNHNPYAQDALQLTVVQDTGQVHIQRT